MQKNCKPGQRFSTQMLPRHLKATRALGFVLADGSPDAWAALAAILGVRLDPSERAALAYASAIRLDVDHMEMTFDAIRDTHLARWGRGQ